MTQLAPLHASLIARHLRGRWHGVLILGPSGSGKSHLAFCAISAGWRLVGDDRVIVWSDGAKIFGRAHPQLAGLIELRGLGIMASPTPPLDYCQIDLVANLVAQGAIERLPDPAETRVAGHPLPQIRIDPFSALCLPMIQTALHPLPVQ
jgi:serine kinase of HPr protein (carbohydrate metabolism regulator)